MTTPNWKWRPLGELFDIGAGKTMSAAARAGAQKVPFLRTSNVLWDEIDLTAVDEMAIPADELANKSLKAGDLLVCEGGDIGRAAVWDGRVAVMSFQNHLHRLRPIQNDVDSHFYVYFLQSAFTQLGIFEGAGNKTTIPNLSRSRLAALDVPHPPPSEQRAIARSLAKVREAITVHSKATLTALELKHAVMNELFTRGLRGGPQKDSEIGPIPESWSVPTFSEVREWLQYGTSIHCTLEPQRFPVLRIPNIKPGRVNVSELKYCELSEEDAGKYMLANGDLLFIRTNGVLERLGSCAVYGGEPSKALFASYLIRARLKPTIDSRYVAYFYASQRGSSLVAGRATPAADGKYNLNTGTIDSLPLPLPPTLEEQRDIVTVLDAIEQKISLHQRKREVLQDLFKALLHKLITGAIAVEELDLSALVSLAESAEEATA